MRMFQMMGLTSETEKYIDENCMKVGCNPCPHCGQHTSERLLILGVEYIDSFYGDGPNLHTYRLKQGGLVKEIIQAEIWSSGPVCFLCLELTDGTRIGEWSKEEIGRA